MWDFMNGMADGVRKRVMPRRRNGMGTMTAMIVGASVGIAAWETVRRSRMGNMANMGSNLDSSNIAAQVLDSLD